jgi:hypothetical protein
MISPYFRYSSNNPPFALGKWQFPALTATLVKFTCPNRLTIFGKIVLGGNQSGAILNQGNFAAS